MITVTEEIIDGLERRTLYLLAGLDVPDDGTLYKASFDGTTTVSRRPPELPSGRELLAYLLREGRGMNERSVAVAREAAIAEIALGQPAKGEGNN
jgi:hypothetical protein